MAAALLWLALGTVPQSPVIDDAAETVEVNHFYDEHARPVFDQVIWRDQDGQVIAWRLLKRETCYPGFAGRGVVILWDGSVLRRVRARHELRTWTQYDRELDARIDLPIEERRGLTGEQTFRWWQPPANQP